MSKARLGNLGGMNSARLRIFLVVCASALACVVPFYLLGRASAIWNANDVPAIDDFWFARMCLPEGLAVYVCEYGIYRILSVSIFTLVNQFVIDAAVPLWALSLAALVAAAAVFARTCVVTGLPSRRGLILFGLLTSSPFLLETITIWSGAAIQSIALLLLAAQLRAIAWARGLESRTTGILVIAGGAVAGLVTYEMVLPFVVATSALLARTLRVRFLVVVVSVSLLIALVVSLSAAGLYDPFRWTIYRRHLFADPWALLLGNFSDWHRRISVYDTLLPSLLRTGFSSLAVWFLVIGLGVLTFLSPSKSRESAARFRLPWGPIAVCFAASFLIGLGYLLTIRSFPGRYLGLVSIFGFAALAWMEGRVPSFALALLLVVQCAVVASLPVHLRDAEMARSGGRPAAATGQGDIIAVEGRLTLGRWAGLFVLKDVSKVLQQVNEQRREYLAPCEKHQRPPEPMLHGRAKPVREVQLRRRIFFSASGHRCRTQPVTRTSIWPFLDVPL